MKPILRPPHTRARTELAASAKKAKIDYSIIFYSVLFYYVLSPSIIHTGMLHIMNMYIYIYACDHAYTDVTYKYISLYTLICNSVDKKLPRLRPTDCTEPIAT